ncbi:MAG: hypothetical protein RLZZ458_472, partial [Planctomycetota bacterium]
NCTDYSALRVRRRATPRDRPRFRSRRPLRVCPPTIVACSQSGLSNYTSYINCTDYSARRVRRRATPRDRPRFHSRCPLRVCPPTIVECSQSRFSDHTSYINCTDYSARRVRHRATPRDRPRFRRRRPLRVCPPTIVECSQSRLSDYKSDINFTDHSARRVRRQATPRDRPRFGPATDKLQRAVSALAEWSGRSEINAASCHLGCHESCRSQREGFWGSSGPVLPLCSGLSTVGLLRATGFFWPRDRAGNVGRRGYWHSSGEPVARGRVHWTPRKGQSENHQQLG